MREPKPLFRGKIPAVDGGFYVIYPATIKQLKRDIQYHLRWKYWNTSQPIILASFGVYDKGREYLERHGANKAEIILTGSKVIMRFIRRKVNQEITALTETVIKEKVLFLGEGA